MNSRFVSEQAIVVEMEAFGANREVGKSDTQDGLFRNYGQAVYAYALRRIGNITTAEDITCEVFIEAIRHAKQRQNLDPLPWLYGIARRKVSDHFRSTKRGPSETLNEFIVAATQDPHQAAEASEASNELKRLVAALPEDQREALLLYCVEELSTEQVAESMRKSVAAVNSLIQRARQTLRMKTQNHNEANR